MRRQITPVVAMFALALAVALLAALTVFVALDQPWVERVGTRDARLLAIAGHGLPEMAVEAGDLVEEPDVLPSYAAIARFLARQGDLRARLAGREAMIVTSGGAWPVTVAPRRPIGSLPTAFWLQLATGAIAALIGGWVWLLRPREFATRMVAVVSGALLLSAFASAIYSTRQIALPPGLFRAFMAANHLGSALFCAAMVGLLLNYPHRLLHLRWVTALFAGYVAWWAMDQAWLMPDPAIGGYVPLLIALVLIVGAWLLQARAGWHDPRDRTILRWFAATLLLGTAIPFLLIVAPNVVGRDASVPQGVAFIFFLLIHLGVAVGVARLRLFELDAWAFWLLYYLSAAVVLLAVDAALIATFAQAPDSAFGLALLAVALIYLPLRGALSRRILGRRRGRREGAVQGIYDLALAPHGARAAGWRELLDRMFHPAQIEPAPGGDQVAIRRDGAELVVPGFDGVPPLRLVHAAQGRRLFAPGDVARAEDAVRLMREALASRGAVERGMLDERARIARDVHDNLGVQLLSALHSRQEERKNAFIRDAIRDLREIVAGGSDRIAIDAMLADLRSESAELAELAGVRLDWQATLDADVVPLPKTVSAMRAILREAVTNAIKHSQAQSLTVRVTLRPQALRVVVSDDGVGLGCQRQGGRGLANMAERVAAVGGTLAIGSGAMGRGVIVDATLPVAAA